MTSETSAPQAALLRRAWFDVAANAAPQLADLPALLDARLAELEAAGRLDEPSLLAIAEDASQYAMEEGAGDVARTLSKRLRRAIYEFLLALDAVNPAELAPGGAAAAATPPAPIPAPAITPEPPSESPRAPVALLPDDVSGGDDTPMAGATEVGEPVLDAPAVPLWEQVSAPERTREVYRVASREVTPVAGAAPAAEETGEVEAPEVGPSAEATLPEIDPGAVLVEVDHVDAEADAPAGVLDSAAAEVETSTPEAEILEAAPGWAEPATAGEVLDAGVEAAAPQDGTVESAAVGDEVEAPDASPEALVQWSPEESATQAEAEPAWQPESTWAPVIDVPPAPPAESGPSPAGTAPNGVKPPRDLLRVPRQFRRLPPLPPRPAELPPGVELPAAETELPAEPTVTSRNAPAEEQPVAESAETPGVESDAPAAELDDEEDILGVPALPWPMGDAVAAEEPAAAMEEEADEEFGLPFAPLAEGAAPFAVAAEDESAPAAEAQDAADVVASAADLDAAAQPLAPAAWDTPAAPSGDEPQPPAADLDTAAQPLAPAAWETPAAPADDEPLSHAADLDATAHPLAPAAWESPAAPAGGEALPPAAELDAAAQSLAPAAWESPAGEEPLPRAADLDAAAQPLAPAASWQAPAAADPFAGTPPAAAPQDDPFFLAAPPAGSHAAPVDPFAPPAPSPFAQDQALFPELPPGAPGAGPASPWGQASAAPAASPFPIAPREGFHLTDPATLGLPVDGEEPPATGEPGASGAPAPAAAPENPFTTAIPPVNVPPQVSTAPPSARPAAPDAGSAEQDDDQDDPGAWRVRQSPRAQLLAERMAQKRREEAARAAFEAAAVPDEHRGRKKRRGDDSLPDLPSARRQLDEHLRRKRGAEAAALLQRLAQELGGREIADLALDSGDRCRALGQSRSATNCYLAAWRADPLYETPLWRLSDVCLNEQEIDLAVGYLERIADLMRSRGDDEGAIGVYRKIAMIAPERQDVRDVIRLAKTTGRLDV